MKDPALCAIAREFFGSDAYDRVMTEGRAEGCEAYWDLVGAILTAAHLYRQAAATQARERGVQERGVAVECVAAGSPDVSEPAVFEDFAVSQGVVCSNCSKQIRFVRRHPAEDASEVRVDYVCRGCGRPSEIRAVAAVGAGRGYAPGRPPRPPSMLGLPAASLEYHDASARRLPSPSTHQPTHRLRRRRPVWRAPEQRPRRDDPALVAFVDGKPCRSAATARIPTPASAAGPAASPR